MDLVSHYKGVAAEIELIPDGSFSRRAKRRLQANPFGRSAALEFVEAIIAFRAGSPGSEPESELSTGVTLVAPHLWRDEPGPSMRLTITLRSTTPPVPEQLVYSLGRALLRFWAHAHERLSDDRWVPAALAYYLFCEAR